MVGLSHLSSAIKFVYNVIMVFKNRWHFKPVLADIIMFSDFSDFSNLSNEFMKWIEHF